MSVGFLLRSLGCFLSLSCTNGRQPPSEPFVEGISFAARASIATAARSARAKIGNFDTQLVQEWFQAFAMNSGMTLHVQTLYGGNDHHIAESCFKGLARALRAAAAIDPRAAGEIPSTKGALGG